MHGKSAEALKLLLAGFMNIAGLFIILVIQYVAFIRTGTIAFTELPDGTTQWLYVNIFYFNSSYVFNAVFQPLVL
jgi:hypothetical protein